MPDVSFHIYLEINKSIFSSLSSTWINCIIIWSCYIVVCMYISIFWWLTYRNIVIFSYTSVIFKRQYFPPSLTGSDVKVKAVYILQQTWNKNLSIICNWSYFFSFYGKFLRYFKLCDVVKWGDTVVLLCNIVIRLIFLRGNFALMSKLNFTTLSTNTLTQKNLIRCSIMIDLLYGSRVIDWYDAKFITVIT